MSVIRHICESSNASPIGAGAVAGNSTSVYPDICHALSALIVPFLGGLGGNLQGGGIQSSIWVTEFIFVGLILPISTYELTCKLTGKKNPGLFFSAVSMLLPVILPFSPLYMFTFGPLYENAIANSMLPASLLLLVQIVNKIANKKLVAGLGLVLSILIVAGAGLCHPNICFILGIFMLPYIVIRCNSTKKKVIAIFGSVIVWFLLYFCPVFKRTVNCNDRVSSGIETAKSIFGYLHLDYSLVCNNELIVAGVFFVSLAIVVYLCMWLNKRVADGWYFFGIGFVLILGALTLFPETSFARFMTGFWYLDTARFKFFFSVMLTPFIFLIASKLFGNLGSRALPFKSCAETRESMNACACKQASKCASRCAILALSILLLGGACYRADNYSRAFNSRIITTDNSTSVLFEESDAQMFEQIKAITGDSGVINNFNDSSLWAYAICGVNVSAKANVANYLGETDRNLVDITSNLSTLGEKSSHSELLKENAVCLNYRYVLQLDKRTHVAVDINDKGNWVVRDLGETSVVNDSTPGFSLLGSWITSSGNYKLYAIDYL